MTTPESEIRAEPLPPAKEKDIIKKNENTDAFHKEGEWFYALSQRWWSQWREYTFFDKEGEDGDESERGAQPGPIDNAELQGDYPLELRRGVMEGNDFVWVHRAVWKRLLKWYGGGPEFGRIVVSRGLSRETMIDMYPAYVRLCWAQEPDGEPNVEEAENLSIGREKTCQDIVNKFVKDRTDEKTSLEPEIRIWYQSETSAPAPKAEEGENAMEDDENQTPNGIDTSSNGVANGETPMQDENGAPPSKKRKVWQVMRRLDLTRPIEAWEWPQGELLMLEQRPAGKDAKWLRNAVKQNWQDFKVGDVIDALDNQKKWYESEIVDITEEKIFVHYIGWASKWDEWIKKDDTSRLAKQGTHTNGPYKRQVAQTSSRTYRSYGGGSYYSNEKGSPVERGVVGLRNLGNTCFMNSTLQCLSNTPILTHYFLEDKYRREINVDNPLGRGGKIAEEWGALVHQLWSGEFTTIAPRQLKDEVGNFAPRFVGYQQQDSSEFLGFLLDGLHEDLNRIHKKPATSAVVSEGRPDAVVAKEAWATHRMRNDSIIVDTMQGQYKSTVVCPDCNNISITFDPFQYLQVPFPVVKNRKQIVTVYFLDPARPITVYGPKIEKTASIYQLKEALSELCGLKPRNMQVAEIWNNKIYKVLGDESSVTQIRDNDIIWVYEQQEVIIDDKPATGRSLSICYVNQLHQKRNKHYYEGSVYSEKFSYEEFGAPLVVTMPRDTSAREVRARIRYAMRPLVKEGVPIEETDSADEAPDNGGENTENDTSKNDHYTIRVRDKSGRTCFHCGHMKSCPGCVLEADSDDPVSVQSNRITLSLAWKSDAGFDVDHLDNIQYHESAPVTKRSARGGYQQPKAPAVQLSDCMEAFTLKERLGEQDAWYCNKCKEHKRATKQLLLWRTPDILVIQLKRFVHTSVYRERINTVVNFPIEGLDMSPWIVHEQNHNDAIYDLYAVSNHMGGMGGGHYTAYGQNLINKKWYSFDDSYVSELNDVNQCVSSSAYVLYYKRRGIDEKVDNGVPSGPQQNGVTDDDNVATDSDIEDDHDVDSPAIQHI